ncbi:lactate oxidase [Deltaproteobacteria bacterium Smac51]|nr:lactate oxidase [Deltaproteobacteria bacterium Smac51]
MAAEAPTISEAEGPIKIINLYELEKQASQKVNKGAFGYVEGGAEDEVTLRGNTLVFDKKQIIPDGLTGLEGVELKTRFLGLDLPSPIILAPMAAHGMVHKEADRATIRGTHKAGTIMSVSTYSSVLVDEIAQSAPEAPFFFQIYMSKDSGYNEFIVKRAKDAGARAIIITIDAGTPGNRESDLKNNYNYSSPTPNVMIYYEGQDMTQSQARALRKVGFSGEDIKFIKSVSGLPVLVKGIQSPEAAEEAIKAGADGIWVSNHGGRQLDGAPASFDMLPIIAKAVDKRVPIVFDSGVRRGTHVFKALASGADIVAIGRPALYGLILGGSEGVNDVFQHLNKELTTAMILAGTKDIEAVKQNRLFDPEK